MTPAVHPHDEQLVARVVLEVKILHARVMPARTKIISPAMPRTIFHVSMWASLGCTNGSARRIATAMAPAKFLALNA